MYSENTTIQVPGTNGREDSLSSGLEPFFAPHGVAVVGASPKAGNQGKHIVQSLKAHGFMGELYTVNSNGRPVEDVPVVTDIKQLPAEVDLVIAAISAPRVLPLLGSLADNGIYHLIIISGGFSETNEEGEALQKQLQEKARELEIRVIGPNGLGVFSAPDHFNSFFLSTESIALPDPGSVALISQSGAFLSQIMDQMAQRGIGVHRAVNFGNRVDVGEAELLEMFGNDPKVNVIGIYLESVQDGRRFFEIAKSMTPRKPVVICKGGRGKQGIKAARAHSASMASSYKVFAAAMDQAGLITVDGLEELMDSLQVLSHSAPTRGNRVLVVSNGGGMGVLMTDLCELAGWNVPEMSKDLQDQLHRFNPDYYSFRNPIDITGSGTNEQCIKILDHLIGSDEFDALLLVLLSGTEGVDSRLGDMLRKRKWIHKTPMVIGAHGRALFEGIKKALSDQHISVFPSGERAARAMNILLKAGRKHVKQVALKESQTAGHTPLPTGTWLKNLQRNPNEMELKDLLRQHNIPVPLHHPVPDNNKLEEAIKKIGFPMVLKVAGEQIQHKTGLGGVRTNLKDQREVQQAWKAMNQMWPGSIWAEKHLPKGLELMVGAYRDPDFGPILLFGSGGKYVELYQDISRILIPASQEEYIRLINQTHAGKIIDGFRGEALAKKHLLDFLQWTASWMVNEAAIQSLDFNPIRLYRDNLVVLDAKLKKLPD